MFYIFFIHIPCLYFLYRKFKHISDFSIANVHQVIYIILQIWIETLTETNDINIVILIVTD